MDGAAIVQLCRDRDERAIPAASAKYGTYCTAIAESILGSAEDTEECVNDPYLNAWSAMPSRRPDLLSAFLGRIVRNLSLNRYRHNTAGRRGGALPAVPEGLSEPVSGGDDVGREIAGPRHRRLLGSSFAGEKEHFHQPMLVHRKQFRNRRPARHA